MIATEVGTPKDITETIIDETTTNTTEGALTTLVNTKTIEQVFFRTNKLAQTEKVTRTIKRTNTTYTGPEALVDRRMLSQFGDAATNEDNEVTQVGDQVFLEFVDQGQNKVSVEEYYKDNVHIKNLNYQIAELKKFQKHLKASRAAWEAGLINGSDKTDGGITDMSGMSWMQRAKVLKNTTTDKTSRGGGSFADKIRSTWSDEPEWKRTLFIDNMPLECDKRDIEQFLEGCTISRINIVNTDRRTGESRGTSCAFAVLNNEKSVQIAVDKFNRGRILNHIVTVTQSKPKKK